MNSFLQPQLELSNASIEMQFWVWVSDKLFMQLEPTTSMYVWVSEENENLTV